jgi:phage shock protein E
MLSTLKNLFGIGVRIDFAQLVKEGAMIVDVRSPAEYKSGHIKNSINIPVDQLRLNLSKLKDKQQVLITCCASGMRSASAKNILQSAGYLHVYNGGGWYGLQRKL